MTNEIVLYKPNEQFQLEVQLKDETVWLNRNQMAMLFDRDVKTIGKHINNALKEELAPIVNHMTTQEQYRTVANFATVQREGIREVTRQVEYYNLDVILSVGYRVKSNRGVEFRRWANKILKEYLFRGYAVNQKLLNIEERIDRKFSSLERRVEKTEQQIDFFVRTSLPPIEQVFFGGDFFEARVLLEKIIKTATNRVIVIDAYVDAATLDLLDVRSKAVYAAIYSGKDLSHLRDMHNAAHNKEPIDTFIWSKPSHDRWLIIDDKLYHCGHSLKDMGHKLSAITLMGTHPDNILKQIK